eukprot:gene12344-14476_t
MIASLPEDMKAIDILVNNAGLSLGSDPVSTIHSDDLDTVMDTNVKGVFRMTRAVLPGMIERNRGHIFNISSIAGSMFYATGSLYCASKAAVNAFTDVLRKEVVHTRIRVTSVVPGMCRTEFIPIYEGNPNTDSILRFDFAGQDITQYLVNILTENGNNISMADIEAVRGVKEKMYKYRSLGNSQIIKAGIAV